MEATRSQTRAAQRERAGARSTAPTEQAGSARERRWRWVRLSACLIALAQQAAAVPAATLLMYRMLENEPE